MSHGLRQNVAQLAATRFDRKRKFTEMDADKLTYYGIATTSLNWQLIELEGNVVKTSMHVSGPSKGAGSKERTSNVIAHIVNVLKNVKITMMPDAQKHS